MTKPLPSPLSAQQKSHARARFVNDRSQRSDRAACLDGLQRTLRVWLLGRQDTIIGAYWPIKGEFDPLPALFRWQESGREDDFIDAALTRKIGLPVIDKADKTLRFHAWYPGCPMERDAYDIPKPKDTEVLTPTLIFVPCVGHGPGGFRLGYGGGFYDRTLASLTPKPTTVGLCFSGAYLPDFEPEPHDVAMDYVLTDEGQMFP